MSAQRKEKKMWSMLDRFFLRVLGEKGRKRGHGGKPGPGRRLPGRFPGNFPLPAGDHADHHPAPDGCLHRIEAPGLDAEKLMEKYLREVQGPTARDQYAGLEWVPRFFEIFRWAFRKVTASSDAWDSTFEAEKDRFDLTIRKCLWYDTCVECGCPRPAASSASATTTPSES